MFQYKMYGYKVESDIELYGEKIDFCESDISIHRSHICEIDKTLLIRANSMQNRNNKLILHFEQIGIFVADSGTHLDVYLDEECSDELAILYIMGSGFSLLLTQRNEFAIHGSCVKYKEKVFIISGESGAGKSTLTQNFIQNGAKLISDDVTRVIFVEGKPYAVPSLPVQKVWKDTIEYYDMICEKREISNRSNKYYIHANNYYLNSIQQLDSIIILQITNEPDVFIQKMIDKQRIKLLLDNTYRIEFIKIAEKTKKHFLWAMNIYNKVSVYSLKRPINIFSVDEQKRLIDENIICL